MKDDPSVTGPRRGRSADERSLTLREVSRATGIPMPTLLRYKREQPKRVPSTGSGSQQRFPEAAVAAFLEIHGEENPSVPQRGRRLGGLLSLTRQKRDVPPPVGRRLPPKPQAEGAPAKPAASTVKLMTLREISEITGVAYPTIARYAAHNGKRIPHVGTGRNRRFPPEAVEVFRSIRKESRRGRPPKNKVASPTVLAEMAALTERIAMLERSQAQLEEQIRSLLAEAGRSAELAANEV